MRFRREKKVFVQISIRLYLYFVMDTRVHFAHLSILHGMLRYPFILVWASRDCILGGRIRVSSVDDTHLESVYVLKSLVSFSVHFED